MWNYLIFSTITVVEMEGTLTTPPQISNMASCAEITSPEAITTQITVVPSPTTSPISGNYRVQLN